MISAWLFYCIMKRVVFWKANSVLSVSSFRLFSRKVLSDLLELITVKFLFLSWFISESKELSRIFNMLSCLKLSKIKVWQVPRLFRRGGFLLGTTTFNCLLLLAPFSFLFVVLFQTCLRFRWPYLYPQDLYDLHLQKSLVIFVTNLKAEYNFHGPMKIECVNPLSLV